MTILNRRATLLLSCLLTLAPLHKPCGADEAAVQEIQRVGGLALPTSDGWDVEFHVRGRQASNDTMKHVAALERVVSLNLRDTQITSAGLKHLQGLKGLRVLHLERTKVSDEGINHLVPLQDLEYLNLYGSNVTDESVAALARLKRLKRLYVWKTGITDAGIQQLAAKLPELKVVSGVELSKLPDLPETKPQEPQVTLAWNPVTNRADAPEKSQGGDNMQVHFENKRKSPVRVYWIGYDGGLKLYHELKPREKRQQNTYSNNVWLITTTEDEPLGWFGIEKPEDAFAIIPNATK